MTRAFKALACVGAGLLLAVLALSGGLLVLEWLARLVVSF